MPQVDIFHTGMLSQFGFTQSSFEAAVFTFDHFTVDQKPDAFLEVELIDIRGLHLLLKGGAHSEES
jgi:hypothetical protein